MKAVMSAIGSKMTMPKRSELEEFVRRGPANGDVAQGLAELRYRILTDGIPSNADGMVSTFTIRGAQRKV
jgi:hypothetical protein